MYLTENEELNTLRQKIEYSNLRKDINTVLSYVIVNDENDELEEGEC